jgi:hypothetical protein
VTTLRYAAEVPIRRYIKIKAEANPFDPAWEGYLEDRQGFKMFNSLKGRKKLIRLWLAQRASAVSATNASPRTQAGTFTTSSVVLTAEGMRRET